MGAYILRRVLLMIPTILGIMAITFVVMQFAPGGPVERIIAQLQGTDVSATARIGGGPAAISAPPAAAATAPPTMSLNSKYRGAQGLDPEFIADLERQFGFDKPPLERFGLMLWNYVRFDFGESYFRDISRARADRREAAGVDLARPVDDAPLLRDLHPARHPQGGARRLALRRLDLGGDHRRLRDSRASSSPSCSSSSSPAAPSSTGSRCAA